MSRTSVLPQREKRQNSAAYKNVAGFGSEPTHALGLGKPVMCLYSNKPRFGFQHVDLTNVS